MAEKLLGQCEECFNQDILYDAILNGRAKRLCKKCLITSGAIEIKKPKPISIQTGRPSVKEILIKMSGLNKEKEPPNLKEGLSKDSIEGITLNDLIERKKLRDAQAKETEQQEEQGQQEANKPINFNIQATKNLRIGDLLKLKRGRERNQEKRGEEKEESKL